MTWRRFLARAAAALIMVSAPIAFPVRAWGNFSDTTANASSTLTAGALQPPTNLVVAVKCVLLGVLRPVADLTWTATTSTGTGYQLDRYKGALLEKSFEIGGTSTITFSDGLGPFNLGLSTAYTWHLRTYLGTWVSSDAITTVSTPLICT
ncbi:MAG TPA: hypothetical protein VGP92_14320 [Acidimicrobiia bacterium]|jgi:hypothetical protein|nr:hypothetical protein [Acidimicrobiia bacterium]